jgi:hypothetical protein
MMEMIQGPIRIHHQRLFSVQLPFLSFLRYLAVNLFKKAGDGWMIGFVSVPVAAGLPTGIRDWNA